jgi:hypothetical protein
VTYFTCVNAWLSSLAQAANRADCVAWACVGSHARRQRCPRLVVDFVRARRCTGTGKFAACRTSPSACRCAAGCWDSPSGPLAHWQCRVPLPQMRQSPSTWDHAPQRHHPRGQARYDNDVRRFGESMARRAQRLQVFSPGESPRPHFLTVVQLETFMAQSTAGADVTLLTCGKGRPTVVTRLSSG